MHFTTKDRNSILTDYGHRRNFLKRIGMERNGWTDGKKASRLSGTLRKQRREYLLFFYSPSSVLVCLSLFLLLAFLVSMIPASASR